MKLAPFLGNLGTKYTKMLSALGTKLIAANIQLDPKSMLLLLIEQLRCDTVLRMSSTLGETLSRSIPTAKFLYQNKKYFKSLCRFARSAIRDWIDQIISIKSWSGLSDSAKSGKLAALSIHGKVTVILYPPRTVKAPHNLPKTPIHYEACFIGIALAIINRLLIVLKEKDKRFLPSIN